MSSPTSIEVPGIVVPSTSGAFGSPVDIGIRGASKARLVVDPAEVGSEDGAQLHVRALYPRETGGPLVVDLLGVAVQSDVDVHDLVLELVPTLRLVPRLQGGSELAAGKSFDVLVLLP